ncbi:MAG TPA: PAS domain S-box protein, partial [Caldimonas sp.]
MAALVQAQRMLANSEATPDELIDGIPDLALTVIQAAAAVFELPEGDAMVCRAASAAATDRAGMQLALRGSISGEAILLNRTLRCDDAETDPRVDAAAFRRSGMRSVVATVVRDKSGPIGVIKLMDHRAAHFGAAEADCLELLAEALGAVIQRKRAEQDAQRALRIQAGIVRLQQQIASSPADLQTSMDLIAERAQELTGAEGASIAFVDGEDLAYRAVCGMAVARLGLRVRLQGSLAGLSVERDELLRCDDSETDPRVNRAACREFGVRSVMIAPLRAGDRVVGALRVVSRRTNAFAQIDGGTLQMLAEWLGVVLHRDAAAEQLRSSEAQYRLIFAGHSLPMWVYDMETLRFLAVNDAAIGQYGFSKAEFLSMTIRDITPPAAFALLDRHLAARSREPATIASWAHRKKDGAVVDVELSANTIRFAGRPARLVLAHNITERKRAERRLEKSEALLNIAARAARVGGWSLDLRDQVFSWSDELCAIHDLPPGSPCTVEEALAFYAPESRAAMGAAMSSMRSDGTPYDLELELISAGGQRIWVRTMGQAVRDAAGAIVGMQGALQDISEKRQAEEKVRTLAASLTTTLESITDAFYTVDRDWRFTYVNSEAERLFQRSRADLMGRVLWETFADLLGGEFERQYRNAVDCNSSVAFEAYYAPWQQWFEVRAYPSEAGLTVYLRDVNERHHEQEQLILLQTCVAWMRDVVIITDAGPLEGSDPRIVFVNEAFSRHTGYSRDEVLGRTPRLLQGPKTQRAELDRISSAVQRCQPVRAEIINYTKSGVEYWVEIEIVPVWSGAAKVTHFIAVQRDTTERRLAQEALRSLNEDLEATVARRTVQLKLTNSVLASKEEEIRSVVEHMADCVITFSDDGIVRSANSKVEAIFGHAPSELVGQDVSTLIPVLGVLEAAPTKDGRLSLEGAIARLGRETEGRHRNGVHLILEVAISRYRIHGK